MLLLKTIHIIAIISWMAGLLYLPRIFVYHAQHKIPAMHDIFLTMERRLLYYIMTPAALVSLGTGLMMMVEGGFMTQAWMHYKLLMVLGMLVFHGGCFYYYFQFARGHSVKNARFFRIFNEIPTLLMVVIVILVVYKP